MKPTCTKVKNPCKICLQQVTNKTGLQCQGACKKWAHFKCLNYTPGKISDIKAGIIKVTCPCPDCDTTQPKEFLTNPPFTCSNNQCPANSIPKCQSDECPSNKPQLPPLPTSQAERRSQKPIPEDYPGDCPNTECSNEAIRCPAVECPNSFFPSQQKQKSHPRMAPPRPPTPPRANQRQTSPAKHSGGGGACRNTPKGAQCFEESKEKKKKSPAQKTCPSECEKEKGKGKDNKDTKGKKGKQPPARSRSSSMLSSDQSGCAYKLPMCSSSDSNVSRDPRRRASMVHALQDMCTTVGKLSVQLKELMCKMMQNI